MSRFDLFFIVLDECDEETDFNIARSAFAVLVVGPVLTICF